MKSDVKFVVLSSRPDSPYADTPTSYEYPARYRRFFRPLELGEGMMAIIYEPRSGGRGRMAYVGWAALRSAPRLSARTTESGQPLWEVLYVDRVQEFPQPVPRDILGEPIEQWLRETDPSKRGIVSSGASVRWLQDADARRILELGHAAQLGAAYDQSDSQVDLQVAERTRHLVEAIRRDAKFRREVMSAYDYRCSVTGLTIGTLGQGRATRLLDAAHIRPVGDRGSDSVQNGLALTPTVHRLFDEGLLTARWSGASLVLVRSPMLDSAMIEAPERGTVIRLDSDMPLILPSDRDVQPSEASIRYHQSRVFRGPQSSFV